MSTIAYKCPCCGAALAYGAASGKLECASCGNAYDLETMEAMPILEKYIDDAFLAGLRQVEINHGRGTGALRNFVHSCLKGNRLVKTYRDGTFHEGGLGVTIVELNQ